MDLTKSIRRQFKRHLEVNDAESFLNALGKGDETHPQIQSLLTKLPAFLESVNLAYSDYDDKLMLASRSLEISSLELNTANRRLEHLVASTSAIMDGLGQGLLFFDRDGICSGVFSKICLEMFKSSPEGKHIGDLLDLDDEQKIDLGLWLDAVFDSDLAMDIADLYDMAPQRYVSDENILRLEYRAMKDNRNKIIAVLLIATDITREENYNLERAKLEDRASQIVAISNNRSEYMDFISEIEDFTKNELSGLWSTAAPQLSLRIHTYKGLASSFHLSHLAHQLHELENLLSKADTLSDAHRNDHLLTVTKQITMAKETGRKILGEGIFANGKTKTIRQESFDKLQEMLKDADPSIREFFVREFLQIPVSEALIPFTTEIKRLCSVQHKPPPHIIVEDNGVTVPKDGYKKLFDSFVHIARNIVDHGLELPAERLKQGKTAEGTISVVCRQEKDGLIIAFSDDGAGIDTEKLRKAMDQKGRDGNIVLTDEDILQSVFLPSVTTANETSLISGRGIGLSAVDEEVKKLGGSVKVGSTVSEGTTLTIRLKSSSPTSSCRIV